MTNTPNESPDVFSPTQEIADQIKQLSENRKITRDQERIGLEAMENPDFALLTNRVMNQGSDPESIRRIGAEDFKKVCEILGLTEEEGVEAIQKAHQRGPAALKDGGQDETLWLLMASISVDESMKSELTDRITQFADALKQLKEMGNEDLNILSEKAENYKKEILDKVKPIGHTSNGVPIYNQDRGFFAAYRSGIKAAIVQAEGYDAVGTTPDTNLIEQGLTVDKELSPNFGLRFK